jgi:hypothetical protein
MGAELFHANGRTDGCTDRHDEVIFAFRNFAKSRLKHKLDTNQSPTIYMSLTRSTLTYAAPVWKYAGEK